MAVLGWPYCFTMVMAISWLRVMYFGVDGGGHLVVICDRHIAAHSGGNVTATWKLWWRPHGGHVAVCDSSHIVAMLCELYWSH